MSDFDRTVLVAGSYKAFHEHMRELLRSSTPTKYSRSSRVAIIEGVRYVCVMFPTDAQGYDSDTTTYDFIHGQVNPDLWSLLVHRYQREGETR